MRHLPLRRELDGVAHQIDEHLTQPVRVASESCGRLRHDFVAQLDAFLFARTERISTVVSSTPASSKSVSSRADAAGFNLGEIQDDR